MLWNFEAQSVSIATADDRHLAQAILGDQLGLSGCVEARVAVDLGRIALIDIDDQRAVVGIDLDELHAAAVKGVVARFVGFFVLVENENTGTERAGSDKGESETHE